MKKTYIIPEVQFELIELSSPLMGSKEFETKPNSGNGGDVLGGIGMDGGEEGDGEDANAAKGTSFIFDDEF